MIKESTSQFKSTIDVSNTLDDPVSLEERKDKRSLSLTQKNEKPPAELVEIQELIENDPNNNSLTKKVLTKQMATELMNTKTSKGDTLQQCIIVNLQNPNAKYPYAVSAECYNTFAEFFGEIIEAIHGIPRQHCMLKPDFICMKNHFPVDLNSKNRFRTIYSEVSIRRNLQNVLFTPKMSSSNYSDVVNKVKNRFKKVCHEFNEASTMPTEWEVNMDAVKNELDDIGAMKNYPKNVSKILFSAPTSISIGSILNFEDHVQYIVSSNDGRIGTLIVILARILSTPEMNEIDYEVHPMFGHLTLNPAYVGTGFMLKVIAKFPFISRMPNLDTLVNEFDVKLEKQCQGKETGLLIITNSKTLNKTESQIVTDFIKAYNKLSVLEDELEITTPMAVQNQIISVESLFQLREKITMNRYKTYTKKYLTEQIANEYSKLKTKFNATLAHCVKHNAFHPTSLYPRACDADCYLLFGSFFNPILMDLNNSKSFDHPVNAVYGLLAGEERYLLSHPHIYSYRIRFSRNISIYPFPNLMTTSHRVKLEKLMTQIFAEIPVEFEGDYYPLSEIDKSPYYNDLKTFKLIKVPNEIDKQSGFCNDWPNNRGVYIVKKNEIYPTIILIVLINFTDHIKVISYESSGKLLNLCYDRATELLKFFDLKLSKLYAKRSGYGFLSSYPNNVGCCMRISVLLLIKIMGERRDLLERYCMKNGLVYRGTNGSGSPAINNVFDISLKSNLNISEIQSLRIFTYKLKDLLEKERDFDPRIPKPINVNCEEQGIVLDEYDDDSSMGFNTLNEDEEKTLNETDMGEVDDFSRKSKSEMIGKPKPRQRSVKSNPVEFSEVRFA